MANPGGAVTGISRDMFGVKSLNFVGLGVHLENRTIVRCDDDDEEGSSVWKTEDALES